MAGAGGRPRKDPGERRTERIQVIVTEYELASIRVAATHAGVSTSAYMRAATMAQISEDGVLRVLSESRPVERAGSYAPAQAGAELTREAAEEMP